MERESRVSEWRVSRALEVLESVVPLLPFGRALSVFDVLCVRELLWLTAVVVVETVALEGEVRRGDSLLAFSRHFKSRAASDRSFQS